MLHSSAGCLFRQRRTAVDVETDKTGNIVEFPKYVMFLYRNYEVKTSLHNHKGVGGIQRMTFKIKGDRITKVANI